MINLTIPPGWTINRAVDTAIATAKAGRCSVQFAFNGTHVEVDGKSEPHTVLNDWSVRYLGRNAS